ncbi:MAG: hypothetical protein OEY25_09270, partial [Candidatus Aminicenantes bacterium]|nr:hypothetical protein [Candidatus Aminicenantes bacterium]
YRLLHKDSNMCGQIHYRKEHLSKETVMDTIASCGDFQSDYCDIFVILKGDWRPLAKATKGDFS